MNQLLGTTIAFALLSASPQPAQDEQVTPGASQIPVVFEAARLDQAEVQEPSPFGTPYFGTPAVISGDWVLLSNWVETNPLQGQSRVIPVRFDGQGVVTYPPLVPGDPFDGNMFGRSLALDGDIALIGAPANNHSTRKGAAYVFRVDEKHRWTQEAKLEPDVEEHGWFGSAVAVSGDHALVAAMVEGRRGKVYAFEHAGDGWTMVQKLADTGRVSAQFGHSLTLDGDWAAVGNHEKPGRVLMFHWSGTEWKRRADLRPGSVLGNSRHVQHFGQSLRLDGDRLLVGMRFSSTQGGAGIIYKLSTTGKWEQEVVLDDGKWDQETVIEDRPGISGQVVCLSGDTAIVGGWSNERWESQLLAFRLNEGSWTPLAEIRARPIPRERIVFFTAAIHGDRVVAGTLFPLHFAWFYQLPR